MLLRRSHDFPARLTLADVKLLLRFSSLFVVSLLNHTALPCTCASGRERQIGCSHFPDPNSSSLQIAVYCRSPLQSYVAITPATLLPQIAHALSFFRRPPAASTCTRVQETQTTWQLCCRMPCDCKNSKQQHPNKSCGRLLT